MSGAVQPASSMRCLISGTAAAASGTLTVTRTISEPASAQLDALPRRRRRIGGVGHRHRLHDDGGAAADRDGADADRYRGVPASEAEHSPILSGSRGQTLRLGARSPAGRRGTVQVLIGQRTCRPAQPPERIGAEHGYAIGVVPECARVARDEPAAG